MNGLNFRRLFRAVSEAAAQGITEFYVRMVPQVDGRFFVTCYREPPTG